MTEIPEMYVTKDDLEELQSMVTEMGNVVRTCHDPHAKFKIIRWRTHLIAMFALRYQSELTGKHTWKD